MDHNLEDSLNLESAIGEMDFEHAGDVVVSEQDITLDTSSQIAMEFQHIQEQPSLMDTGNEEIIVSDFMSDQFSLQEYSVQDDQTTTTTTTEESNQQNVLTTQTDPLIDLQYETQTVVQVWPEPQLVPKSISVKAAPAPVRTSTATVVKKSDQPVVTSAPRQIAIAPKPPKLVPTLAKVAPRPVALVSNKGTFVKKLPISGVIQSDGKGTPMVAQIGKQLVMVPSGNQKIKLVTSGSSTMPNIQLIKASTNQAQLITTKNVVPSSKPVMAKVISLQGQSNVDLANQQTVITKILPSTSTAAPQARYVMQQKTVPISLGSKVLLASPTKQGVKFTKKQQIIAIKSPAPKLMPAPALGATTTKKVVISANPAQNVILKTAQPKTAHVIKDGKLVVQQGAVQRSQLHQINVPGKGIQYIRLITNDTTAATKTVTKTQTPTLTVPSKSFVLTDSKGNLIQMSSEKMNSGQPPPLVFTGNNSQPVVKWQKKFVRIAAAPPKTSVVTAATSRSAQSLLAPLSPLNASVKIEQSPTVSVASAEEFVEEETSMEQPEETGAGEADGASAARDSKAALRALIADTVGAGHDLHKLEITYEPDTERQEHDDSADGMGQHEPPDNLEEQLIVIPSNYMKTGNSMQNEYRQDDESGLSNILPDSEAENSYLTPRSPQQDSGDLDMVQPIGLRPRRACNCTKSQCLKLYCDCFANGEFCNRCNCNNCYNNLNYEELRQKAIRACLERNPNAFRPKIGKSKTGGPEMIRRHNKGCHCKRSGCLKNYCECYEAKIACTSMCKCFGCRNVEETLHRVRRRDRSLAPLTPVAPRPPRGMLYRAPPLTDLNFMTAEVIEAVCQCLVAAAADGGGGAGAGAAAGAGDAEPDPVRDVIDEFSRCLQDIITASNHAPLAVVDEGNT